MTAETNMLCPNCKKSLQGNLFNPLLWECQSCDYGLVLSIPEAQQVRPFRISAVPARLGEPDA